MASIWRNSSFLLQTDIDTIYSRDENPLDFRKVRRTLLWTRRRWPYYRNGLPGFSEKIGLKERPVDEEELDLGRRVRRAEWHSRIGREMQVTRATPVQLHGDGFLFARFLETRGGQRFSFSSRR